MITNKSPQNTGTKAGDCGRYIGGCIYLILGIFLVATLVSEKLPTFESVSEKLDAFDKTKILWCLGWAAVGFAFNAFNAARKAVSTKSAWPLYLWFYFPLICVLSFFAYCSIEVFTVNRLHFFYPLAACLSMALGFHSDKVSRDIFGYLPGKK